MKVHSAEGSARYVGTAASELFDLSREKEKESERARWQLLRRRHEQSFTDENHQGRGFDNVRRTLRIPKGGRHNGKTLTVQCRAVRAQMRLGAVR